MQIKIMRNERGFTLIEIIAVLVMLGLLAAIALPKYMDIVMGAKLVAAKGEIAEMKSSINLTYAKLYLKNSKRPVSSEILTELGSPTTLGVAPDNWGVAFSAASTTVIILSVTKRGDDTGYNATGTWTLPQ
jgi:prepilin-type N-terminal cleavage/methylation domain-containing protein